MSVVDEIRNDLDTIGLLADWLGPTGSPVNPMVAEFRSQRCLIGNDGEPCPHNREPNWWERHVKEPIARAIRGELELKSGMELRVESEEKLHMCDCCGCCLRLKVWTPTNHIGAHLSDKALAKTPDYCWMRSELKELH